MAKEILFSGDINGHFFTDIWQIKQVCIHISERHTDHCSGINGRKPQPGILPHECSGINIYR